MQSRRETTRPAFATRSQVRRLERHVARLETREQELIDIVKRLRLENRRLSAAPAGDASRPVLSRSVLRARMRFRGLSVDALAEVSGYEPEEISALLKSVTFPIWEVAEDIAQALRTNLADLLADEPEASVRG